MWGGRPRPPLLTWTLRFCSTARPGGKEKFQKQPRLQKRRARAPAPHAPRIPGLPACSRSFILLIRFKRDPVHQEQRFFMPKRTFQPNRRHRSKTHGFLTRMKTKAGRAVISRRRAKGRKRVSVKPGFRE